MIIKGMDTVHVRVPLEEPYVFQRGRMDAFESVIVRIVTDTGVTGFGENAPLFRSQNTPASIKKVLDEKIREFLVGKNPMNIEMLVEEVLRRTNGNVDVLAGVDLALWDIMGKSLGKSVFELLGGCCQDPIAVDYTLSAEEPGEMARTASRLCGEGYRGVVVKITGKSIDEDARRVRAVRDALSPESTVRVDCNGAYSAEDAIDFLGKIRDLDIEFVEQPVPAADMEGLIASRRAGIPIVVDESLKTMQEALSLVAKGACDVMNIKVANVGGLLMAKRMAAIASAAGLPVVVGGRTSLEISRCASRHFAASTYGAIGRKHEGPGPASQSLTDDVVTERVTVESAAAAGGYVRVSKNPGLGANVVWDKVMHYARS